MTSWVVRNVSDFLMRSEPWRTTGASLRTAAWGCNSKRILASPSTRRPYILRTLSSPFLDQYFTSVAMPLTVTGPLGALTLSVSASASGVSASSPAGEAGMSIPLAEFITMSTHRIELRLALACRRLKHWRGNVQTFVANDRARPLRSFAMMPTYKKSPAEPALSWRALHEVALKPSVRQASPVSRSIQSGVALIAYEYSPCIGGTVEAPVLDAA